MSFLVTCTFDLRGASNQDYQNAYSDLEKIGLKKVHTKSSGGQAVIPTTTTMGSFNGTGAARVVEDVRDAVQAAYKARRFKSELFLTSGGTDWAWVPATT
jgi:hypothetical protein